MKLRNTVVLVAIFALLLGYFLLVEKGKEIDPVDPRVKMMEPVPIFDFSDTDVVDMDLSNNTTRTVIRRVIEDGSWELVEPIREDAVQEDRINFFAQQLATFQANRVITDTEVLANLDQYGLDPPEVTGTIGLQDGRSFTIYVGDKTPGLTDRYVRLAGDDETVYMVGILVPNYIVDFVKRPPVEPTPTSEP